MPQLQVEHVIAGLIGLLWLAGAAAFIASWAARTRCGLVPLADRPDRPNHLGPAVALGLLAAFWILPQVLAGTAVALSEPDGKSAEYYVILQAATIVGEVIAACIILAVAAWAFDGGLRGFGFRLAGVGWAVARGLGWLAAVIPIVLVVLIATRKFFSLFGLEHDEHPVFQYLKQQPGQPAVLATSIVLAVIAAPLAEELLFRGILQSYAVKLFGRRGRQIMPAQPLVPHLPVAEPDPRFDPAARVVNARSAWLGIIMTSAFFALVHLPADAGSVPALFILAVALGYVYEVTGSLWACIAMHAGFNGVNVAMFLIGLRSGS